MSVFLLLSDTLLLIFSLFKQVPHCGGASLCMGQNSDVTYTRLNAIDRHHVDSFPASFINRCLSKLGINTAAALVFIHIDIYILPNFKIISV